MNAKVTNNDIAERLVRVEEAVRNSTDKTAEASQLQRQTADKISAAAERSIKMEGVLSDHDKKIDLLFKKSDQNHADVDLVRENMVPSVSRRVDRIFNYGTAAIFIGTIVWGLAISVGSYWINQQSKALDTLTLATQQTANSVQSLNLTLAQQISNLGSRMSVVEYHDGVSYQPSPQQQYAPPPTNNLNLPYQGPPAGGIVR